MNYEVVSHVGGLAMMILGAIAVILVFVLGWDEYRSGGTIGYIGIGISLLIIFADVAFMWFYSTFCA